MKVLLYHNGCFKVNIDSDEVEFSDGFNHIVVPKEYVVNCKNDYKLKCKNFYINLNEKTITMGLDDSCVYVPTNYVKRWYDDF